ncbi:hypothetical protein [Halomonas sp. HAL1]|uniref:hypothetical protein n=1 Tax=Halomonas sp. HAL1 TaxID=550984 RepID=UPI00022D334F|nr:hypothetical protein [Halomonas sp. HAL1]EHA17345.1 hypothetical protein HAL1_01758 [Halomonas sp. HAL1]WKV91423.1 hypothetical protein Q3Y66_11045 [Halomonas sp. HAL1]
MFEVIMEVAGFIVFLVFSHFGVMQVFRLTTYHRYFWPSLPLLVGYAGLVGWALFALELHPFFLWQLALTGTLLFIVGKKQSKSAEAMRQLAGDDADAVRFMARSAAKTTIYYIASSIVYLVFFAITYVWLYNT